MPLLRQDVLTDLIYEIESGQKNREINLAIQTPVETCLGMDLVEASRPPDPELVDLIEQAFLEGQIDSDKAGLAYAFLMVEVRLSEVCDSPEFH